MKIVSVVGTRPNFIKIAPISRAVRRHNDLNKNSSIELRIVHTGQHYDHEMSNIFFKALQLPQPDIHLGMHTGTHAEQTGKIMIALEKVFLAEEPDMVMVVGDVNSTLAGALAAAKIHIPVAHVEAGLRSYDRQMPEEINRVLTDYVSDYLFTTMAAADENLIREGIAKESIYCVGDVMIDNLLFSLGETDKSTIIKDLGLDYRYALLTLHRPSNVDDKDSLCGVLSAVKELSRKIEIVFPVHPRTKNKIEESGSGNLLNANIKLIDPLGFLDFIKLLKHAEFIMTDSGGIQQETTVLGIPCLTLRDVSEKPLTISHGTNILCGNKPDRILKESRAILKGKRKKAVVVKSWDGKAADRIVKVLANNCPR